MNTGFKSPKKTVKPTDLIRLSFDDEEKKESPKIMTDKEMKQMFGTKLEKDGAK